jgi:ParB-like chromosome segregation protein Spo0J
MSKKSGHLRIEYRSPHELRPRADNAKVHSPQQIKKLEKSIRRFGFLNPVLISDDDEIIGGHGRVEAAKEAGLPLIPTVRLSTLTPAERLAYNLADNRLAELARYDRDLLAVQLEELTSLEELGTLAPDQVRAKLMALLSRVDINRDRVEIRIRRCRLAALLGGQPIDPTKQEGETDTHCDEILTLTVMARLQRVGREMRMLVEKTDEQTTVDPGLLRIVARAHDIQARLMQNTGLTVRLIASQERVSEGYISRLLRLPSLAPDIITAIINGKNPPRLTAKKLMRVTLQIPVDWSEQRKLLGFQ